jgi:hypothetical protein
LETFEGEHALTEALRRADQASGEVVDRLVRFTRKLFWATLALAFVTFLLVAAGFYQGYQTQRQADLAKRQADIAERQLQSQTAKNCCARYAVAIKYDSY